MWRLLPPIGLRISSLIVRLLAVWASVLALKTTHAKLVVWCIYATAVFGNEGPAFTLLRYVSSRRRAWRAGLDYKKKYCSPNCLLYDYDWALAKIVSIWAHRVRGGRHPATGRPLATGLPDFWHVIVMSVFIQSSWCLCHLVEQLLIYRLSSFQNCHFSAAYIF